MSEKLPIRPARVKEAGIKTTSGGDPGRSVARVDRAPPTWVVLKNGAVIAAADQEAEAQARAQVLGGEVQKTDQLPVVALVVWTMVTLTGVFTVIGLPLLLFTVYRAHERRKRLARQALALTAPRASLSGRAEQLMQHATNLHARLQTAPIPDIARSDLEDSLEDIQRDLEGLHATETGLRDSVARAASDALRERLSTVERAYDALGEALGNIDAALAVDDHELGTDLASVAVKAQAARKAAQLK